MGKAAGRPGDVRPADQVPPDFTAALGGCLPIRLQAKGFRSPPPSPPVKRERSGNPARSAAPTLTHTPLEASQIPAMIKTLCFDFGNVIGFFDHDRAISKLARHTDMAPTELALVLYGGVILDDYEAGRIATPEYVREARLNGRVDCPDDEFLAHFVDIFWPNPEVCDLIPKLAGRYRIVLASNTCDAHYVKYCEMFADTLAHFHDTAGASHRIGARKPHREFFAGAHAFADAEPHECVFVDDLAVNVEAAERFGWKGVLYRPDGSLPHRLRELGVVAD